MTVIYSHRLASQVENHELVSNHIAIKHHMQYNVIKESLCQDRPRQIRGRLNLVWCALRRSLQRKSWQAERRIHVGGWRDVGATGRVR